MRQPAVAGQFYAGDEESLTGEIEACYASTIGPGELPRLEAGKRRIRGLVVPHAGYMYSGPVAAHAYLALAKDGFPEEFVILGPNHTGMGKAVSLALDDFKTPLGIAEVDKELGKRLLKDIVESDMDAHRYEHSIEVQLPFLQYVKKEIKFVPICMGLQDYETAEAVGKIIRETIKGLDVVVIASTDFSHYEPREIAARKDKMAIDKILALDPKGLYGTITKNNISMCGYGPVMAMLNAVEGKEASLLKYATSGDVQPMRDVVGYAAIAVKA